MAEQSALERAIRTRELEYVTALDRLESYAPEEMENEARAQAMLLREAIELVRCLRRLTRGRSPDELHAAFGAPGDFGYETPIGDALARTYRGES